MKVTIGCFEVGKKYALDIGEPLEGMSKQFFPYNRPAGTGTFEGYDSVDNTYTFFSDEYNRVLKFKYFMNKDYPNLYPIKEPDFDKIFNYLKQIEDFTQKIREELL